MRSSIACLAILVSIVPVFAVSRSLTNDVKSPGPMNGLHIVTFKSASAKRSFESGNHTVHCYEWVINGCAGNFTNNEIEELKKNPDVEEIYEDGIVQAAETTQSESPSTQNNATWGLARLSSRTKLQNQDVGATNFKYYYFPQAGEEVHIYSVDTGVYVDHADFEGRAKWGATFGLNPDKDDNGHGTHMAGLAAGKTYGVAKMADIFAVKVLDHEGKGRVSDVISGLDYVYSSARRARRLSIACLGFTTNGSKPLDDAIAELASNSIFVVAAAGNTAEDASGLSPARSPNAITVAASTIQDKQAKFSNYGPVVNIFAPGEGIISAGIKDKHACVTKSGTSMAAAFVTGLIAHYSSIVVYDQNEQMMDILRNHSLQDLSGVSENTPNLLANNGYGPKGFGPYGV